MASKAAVAKYQKMLLRLNGGSTKLSKVRLRNRCLICGRTRGYIRRFMMCRICFRQKALAGELPGVRKISW
ncbi:MAG: uS14 family ribosomal protein [Candidatus Dojkabacteria bacterium]|nr:uS14 family ribosomal protein [Candidatus Dojkabacteria bacterium]